MSEPCLIYDDPRPISCISFDDPDGSSWTVGEFNVTRIAAYREHGLSDFTPWLAVYRGDEICARVPAWKVTIVYAAEVTHG